MCQEISLKTAPTRTTNGCWCASRAGEATSYCPALSAAIRAKRDDAGERAASLIAAFRALRG